MDRVEQVIPDQTDRRVIELMLHGERRTAVFAEAMGVAHLGKDEQKRMVKRKKDQLKKRLQRLGIGLQEANGENRG